MAPSSGRPATESRLVPEDELREKVEGLLSDELEDRIDALEDVAGLLDDDDSGRAAGDYARATDAEMGKRAAACGGGKAPLLCDSGDIRFGSSRGSTKGMMNKRARRASRSLRVSSRSFSCSSSRRCSYEFAVVVLRRTLSG